MRSFLIFCVLAGVLGPCAADAQKKAKPPEPPPPVAARGGHMVYTPDQRGDRIPDFSYAGYKNGDIPLPDVQPRVTVPLRGGDATFRIQAALDYVGTLPADDKGIRG